MDSKYSIQQHSDYLLITISGNYNPVEFKLFPEIILKECKKANKNKVLVNGLQVKGTSLSTMQRFEHGEDLAKVIRSKVKVAIVWPEEDIDKFAETVAVNRGGLICVLGDISSAEKWLGENDM